MQHTSDDVLQKQRELRKKIESGFSKEKISQKKSDAWLKESGPGKDDVFIASNTFERDKTVVVPSNKDILCGRGKSFFNHEGNRRFRDIVDKYMNPYIETPQRSKRSEIVKAVVHETLETGARFLKKAENKQEWYDGGGKFATEKVGHALRDATSDRSQQLSKKLYFLHEQKKRQHTLGGEDNASTCDGTKTETLGLEAFSILPHDSILECMEAKEKPMRTRRTQSPCCEVDQMSTIKYDKENPILVENSIFSEASFHNDFYAVFSEKHKYGSFECDDAIDTASLEMKDKVEIHPPLLDSEQCQHTNFNDIDFTCRIHDDVKKFSSLMSSTSEIQENDIAPCCPQESFITLSMERGTSLFESRSKNSPYTQEPQMVNFKHNECNPTIRAASLMRSELYSHLNFDKTDSQTYQHGNLECLKQSTLATAHTQKERNFSIQSKDVFMNCNEQILIPSDSIKNAQNNLGKFQESDYCNSQRTNKMGLASSVISDHSHNAMLSEFSSKNHNRTQSCGSLDSSHIDIFNNIHLEELDLCLTTASSLGNQDDSDSL